MIHFHRFVGEPTLFVVFQMNIGIFLIKTLAAAGIKNGDMIMAVHADMLQFNSSGQSNSSSRSRTSSTTGQPDFDASARQLIQSCRNDRQKRNQV